MELFVGCFVVILLVLQKISIKKGSMNLKPILMCAIEDVAEYDLYRIVQAEHFLVLRPCRRRQSWRNKSPSLRRSWGALLILIRRHDLTKKRTMTKTNTFSEKETIRENKSPSLRSSWGALLLSPLPLCCAWRGLRPKLIS